MSKLEIGDGDVASPAMPRKKRKFRRLLGFAGLSLIGVGAAFGFSAQWALRKTREVPDFYVQAAQRMPTNLVEASRELEDEVEELTTQVGRLGGWEATFTESQINAWLVHQLPQEFSKVLPSGVEQPRVVIQDDKILAAARYRHKSIDTVVSFELGIQLTAEPNVLAIEVRQLRAGALPLPLGQFVDHITRRAARDGLEIRWDTNDSGFPIALVTVPSVHPSYVRTPVIVEAVSMSEGRIRMAGHTGPEARIAYQPRGPVYKLASHRTRRRADHD